MLLGRRWTASSSRSLAAVQRLCRSHRHPPLFRASKLESSAVAYRSDGELDGVAEDYAFPAAIRLKPESADHAQLLSQIKAFLIDLDGTMYIPSGGINGAAAFHSHLINNNIPYVFCSNTGAKSAEGVQVKLSKTGISGHGGLAGGPVPLSHIYTAAQAQCAYLIDHIPRGAKVFVFAGGNDAEIADSFWMQVLRQQNADLVDSWDVRTFLTDREAKSWAKVAASSEESTVFVLLFSDGSIHACRDPTTGELGFADWSFDVIKKAGYLISHGADFICTAEDAYNVQIDGFPLPGPGMIIAMFRKLVYPRGRGRLRVCGKGGTEGSRYMLDKSISMLRAQGFSGHRSEIVIVGDRFDTDIRAGVQAGIRTCLVESGAHRIDLQKYFPQDRADFVAGSVADLIV